MNMMQKVRIAVYGRNSDDSQSPSSIDDQMRRSLDYAEKLGLEASTVLRFRDDDMSGYKRRAALARPGFKALLAAWDRDEFDVLVVDELSRLGRNPRQLLEIIERLDETTVRLICTDGIDTDVSGWRMALGFKGVMAQEESAGTSHRVKRGMVGQLVRGYMMAPPPFGYRSERIYGEAGRPVGTVWHIVEDEAELVREMYRLRITGVAYAKIAKRLNDSHISPPRGAKFWRASVVRNLLRNPIFRGEVVWYADIDCATGAGTGARKATGKGREERVFERPLLRIVSDELWHGAQKGKVSRTGYGGGRLAYSGVIQCGCCHNLLSSSSKGKAFACGSCGASRLAGSPDAPEAVPTISVAGLTAVIQFALERVFDDERIALLRERLKDRLAEGPEAVLAGLRKKCDRAKKTTQHLLRLICQAEESDALLDAEYAAASVELRTAERELKAVESAQPKVDRQAIADQIEADPTTLAGKLLDGKLPAAHVRAVLAQLFPRFVFLGRESRTIARFEIDFAPGVAVAWLTETKPVLDESVTLRLRLIGSAKRPVVWQVIEE